MTIRIIKTQGWYWLPRRIGRPVYALWHVDGWFWLNLFVEYEP